MQAVPRRLDAPRIVNFCLTSKFGTILHSASGLLVSSVLVNLSPRGGKDIAYKVVYGGRLAP